jgi:hypothetical protein
MIQSKTLRPEGLEIIQSQNQARGQTYIQYTRSIQL